MQKTAYESRISDWSSDVCSSDLGMATDGAPRRLRHPRVIEIGGEARQLCRRAVQPGEVFLGHRHRIHSLDRQSVAWGKRVSVRVVLSGRRIIHLKKTNYTINRALCTTSVP